MNVQLLNSELRDSITEISAEMLGLEGITENATNQLDTSSASMHLPIKIEQTEYVVGLVASEQNSQRIMAAMLGMEDGEEEFDMEEINDSIGEMINLIGGRLKGKLNEHGVAASLETPVAANPIHPNEGQFQFSHPNVTFWAFLGSPT